MFEDYKDILARLSEDWLVAEVDHRVSHSATNAFWQLAISYFPRLCEKKKEQNVKRKIPMFSQIRQTLKKKNVPPISMEVAYQEKKTGKISIVKDTNITPVSMYPPSKYCKVYEQATVKVRYCLAKQGLFVYRLSNFGQF